MRRHQKYTRKLPKIKIDAQKSEECCSRILTIKNGSNPVFEPNILAGVEGLEPSRTVLETGMLPLHHTPKERHIKLFLCYNTVIGTRLWRQCHIKKTVQIVPTAPPFVALGLLNLMPFDALLMLLKNLCKFDAQLPKNRHT